jgi:hypothetical protein
MRNAMAQDAGLGRGTESPYLDILNHIGLQYDENAPTGVSDEIMRAIGPSSAVRRLERDWADHEAALQAKYGKSTKAAGADKEKRERLRNDLRAATQLHRRKIETILRQEHFKERQRKELDRQLRGIHTPQQPLQKVTFSLPERRLLGSILGDLDEDLPEDEIVLRKIDAINAWVDYAWKIEPKEPKPQPSQNVRTPSTTDQVDVSQAIPEPPVRGRAIASKPWFTSMIPNPVSPPVPMPSDAAVIQTPPPPYVAVVDSAAIPAGGGVVAPSASRTPIRPHECIFCGRRFTRKGKMWDCAERHLKRRTTEIVPCPYPECKSKGFVSENEERFKNHIWTVHKTALRPKITIRTGAVRRPPEPATVRIIIAPRAEKHAPRPRIVLRVGAMETRPE